MFVEIVQVAIRSSKKSAFRFMNSSIDPPLKTVHCSMFCHCFYDWYKHLTGRIGWIAITHVMQPSLAGVCTCLNLTNNTLFFFFLHWIPHWKPIADFWYWWRIVMVFKEKFLADFLTNAKKFFGRSDDIY